MNFVSPGPYVYWSLAAGPTFLRGWRDAPACGLGFLGGFYAALIGTFAFTILLFGVARRLGPQVNRALLAISAAALAAFGFFQLWLGAA